MKIQVKYFDKDIDKLEKIAVGDMIDFLIEEKRFTGGKTSVSKIEAQDDFGVSLNKESLIAYIQEDIEREKKLKEICQEVWTDIQNQIASRTKRVNRYE